jgi:cAMP-dependent protein kinase regulator
MVGEEMMGSKIVSVKETRSDAHDRFIKVKRELTLANGSILSQQEFIDKEQLEAADVKVKAQQKEAMERAQKEAERERRRQERAAKRSSRKLAGGGGSDDEELPLAGSLSVMEIASKPSSSSTLSTSSTSMLPPISPMKKKKDKNLLLEAAEKTAAAKKTVVAKKGTSTSLRKSGSKMTKSNTTTTTSNNNDGNDDQNASMDSLDMENAMEDNNNDPKKPLKKTHSGGHPKPPIVSKQLASSSTVNIWASAMTGKRKSVMDANTSASSLGLSRSSMNFDMDDNTEQQPLLKPEVPTFAPPPDEPELNNPLIGAERTVPIAAYGDDDDHQPRRKSGAGKRSTSKDKKKKDAGAKSDTKKTALKKKKAATPTTTTTKQEDGPSATTTIGDKKKPHHKKVHEPDIPRPPILKKTSHRPFEIPPSQTYDKIMGVWGAREEKLPFATPLATIQSDSNSKTSEDFSSPPRLCKEDVEKRWESKVVNNEKQEPGLAPPSKLRNVWAEKLQDRSSAVKFEPPVFKKTEAEKKFLARSFERDIAFSDLASEDIGTLVDAFERVEFEKGSTIARTGDTEVRYSIVQTGEVSFHANGNKVGKAGPGEAFGELALLYSCPRTTDVRAEDHQTVLFQIDQTNFREVMREQMHRSEEEKTKLLRSVPIFKDVDETDLRQLSRAMVPHNFKKGENLSKTFKDAPFCLVQQGTVMATDTTIGPGESFGEKTLKQKEAPKFDVAATSDGTVFTIDRESFDRVFGDFSRLSRKFGDKQALVSSTGCSFCGFIVHGALPSMVPCDRCISPRYLPLFYASP